MKCATCRNQIPGGLSNPSSYCDECLHKEPQVAVHKIQAYDSHLYRQLYVVTERRDGAVFRTRFVGYVFASRPRGEDEVYSSLSTNLTRGGGEIELNPWVDTRSV